MFDTENSNAPAQDVTSAASSPASDVNPAASSPASDVKQSTSSTDNGGKPKEQPSFADKVSSAIDAITKRKSSEASPTAEKTEQKQDQSTDVEGQKDPKTAETDDEPSAGEFKDHPVFKKIIAERKAARAERDKALKEAEAYKADAMQYQAVDTFLKTNQLSYQDAGEALKLAALARTNPAEFYKKLTDLAGQWGQHLGEVLPAELQKQVDEGLVSEELARELARSRGQIALTQEQLERKEQQVRAADNNAEMQYRQQMVDSWVAQAAKTDPAIDKKMPLISSRLSEILMKEGNPKDANDAWARLNRAYTEVTNYLKNLQPAKPLTPAIPQSTGTPKGAVTSPTNYGEAWDAAFARLGAR